MDDETLATDDGIEGGGPAVIRLQASPDDRGKRLDAVLAASGWDNSLSRSRIANLIKAGCAQIDSHVETNPARKLRGGEELTLRVPEAAEAVPQAEAIPLDILFEDDALIVVNKPAGLVVHPGAGHSTGTLVNALLHHCGTSLSGIGGVKRPGIVHRLDRDTSGVMVVAKTDQAHQHLSAQFADHGRTNALERQYTAFVWGVPKVQLTVDAPLGRDRSNRLKMTVRSGPDTRHAVTHLRREAIFGDPDRPGAARIVCTLETGRTHQIRVHCAHIGHGLIGDQDYGRKDRTKGNLLSDTARNAALAFPRQALQARLLQFTHPITGEIKRFEVNLDADLQTLETALAQA